VAGLRIIGGTLKGRRLDGPRWDGLRPTSDRLRETLFNVLGPRIEGARVLDGYAGTGAVGIEALSRGAAHVTFVDEDPRAATLIAANLERCGLRGGTRATERSELRRGRDRASRLHLPEGTKAAERSEAARRNGARPPGRASDAVGGSGGAKPPRTEDERYAIIRAGFAPAARLLAGTAFDIIFLDPPYGAAQLAAALEAAAPLVGPGTLLVVEYARRDAAPESAAGLTRTRELRSGDSALAFYAGR
jgi:16S rRNA G966 N2-methylase RsmD